jgi:signal transduction histidine kinase
LGWRLGGGAVLFIALFNLKKLWLRYTERGDRSLEDESRAERKRIARELHDTLLQGLQGVLLELEVLSLSLPEAERERVARIERKLRHIVVEGRNAINALRLPRHNDRDWVAAILDMGERAAASSNVEFTLKIKGAPWKLPAKARIEVLAVVREGVRNAFEHAYAKTISVVILYTERGLKVSINDDGIGVSEQQLELRQEEGHWGIAGMHERAEKLMGRLRIKSQSFNGTTVSLVVPKGASLMRPRPRWRRGQPSRLGESKRWGRFFCLKP